MFIFRMSFVFINEHATRHDMFVQRTVLSSNDDRLKINIE